MLLNLSWATPAMCQARAAKRLAGAAFAHTAAYDVAVASWFSAEYAPTGDATAFPAFLGATWERKNVLRYGENPHQAAAIYTDGRGGLAAAEQLPTELTVTARTPEGEIMGVRHASLTVEGVQFHPESVLTPAGPAMMASFLAMRGGHWHE